MAGKVRRERCESCYRKQLRQRKRGGDYTPPTRSRDSEPVDFILRCTAKDSGGCWLWTSGLDAEGYPNRISVQGRKGQPYRLLYELTVGPIPSGMELDHTCHSRDPECVGGKNCRHRRCVNPAHLESVSGEVNNSRSSSPTAINAEKTHCIRGHEFTAENTHWRLMRNGQPKPSRQCRACRRMHRQKAQALRSRT